MLPSANFNANVFNAIPPGVIKDDAAFVSNVIDLASDAFRGSQFVCIPVQLGSIDADLAVLRVQQSDDKTDDTTLGGTPTTLLDVLAAVTPGATDDGKIYFVTIDLRQQTGRYLLLEGTAGDGAAGTYLAAVAFGVCPAVVQPNNNAADHVTG